MLRKDIEEKFPFLSVVTYGGSEYIGIINNQDAFITSMYIYTDLRSDSDKAKFIELGEVWCCNFTDERSMRWLPVKHSYLKNGY